MTVTSTSLKPFPLGQLMITTHAADKLDPFDVRVALGRHSRGDWGEVCQEDAAENEHALRERGRLLSVYRDRFQKRFYILTEADHSVTTVLFPEDY